MTTSPPIFNVRLSPEHRARLSAIAKHLGGLTAGACVRLLIAEKYEAIKDALPVEWEKAKSVQPEGLVYDDSGEFAQ